LFADSDKDVEIFLLNNKIPYKNEEHRAKLGHERHRIPMFVLDGEHGIIRLSVFATDDGRKTTKSMVGNMRADSKALENLLN
jgi:hypothetical protein